MIVNTARIFKNEYPRHYKTKRRLGRIADTFVTALADEKGYDVRTAYEFLFDEIQTDRGIRCYRGDVVCFMINRSLHTVDRVFNIEIDGYHKNDDKMNFRDWNLMNGVHLPPEVILQKALRYEGLSTWPGRVVSCPTLRVSAFIENVEDDIIQDEIEQFYFKYVYGKAIPPIRE